MSAAAAPDSVETLLRAVTVNVLVGNGDAHAKNFSLLHQASGALTLCPLYDLLCTLHYGDDRLAMYVDNVHRTNRVTRARVINEAMPWGMSRARASAIVDDIIERAPGAIAAAQDETPELPDSLVATVHTQLENLTNAS